MRSHSSLSFKVPSHWVSCSVCGHTAGKRFHTESGFDLFRCSHCRFIYVNPQPNAEVLTQHYQTYFASEESAIREWGQMMLPLIRYSAKLVLQHTQKKRGRLLDVGCGFGFFLSQMRSLGFEVQGVDISEPALRYARERMDLIVYNRPLTDFPEASFDVLTAFYVIEHVPNPKEWIQQFFRLLKPGGLLVLRWPHTAPITLLTRPFYDFKLHDCPSHLSDFSVSTIRKLLLRNGFVSVQTCIGGYTAPKKAKKLTAFFGNASLFLEKISDGALLIPGVSKTTLAIKPPLLGDTCG